MEKRDLDYFRALWNARRESPEPHSAKIWDARAEEWIADLGPLGAGKRGMSERVAATAKYLRSRGLLGAESAVADIGCGPGLFVHEFAKTAGRAAGFDFSRRFLDYGAERAAALGLHNAEFTQCDFLALDVDDAGLTGKFDLVFTSITPAASGRGSLEKLMKMSRAYCYNASFVNVRDDLAERVSSAVFGQPYLPRMNGSGFYAKFNLLILSGYYPETSYYADSRTEVFSPSIERAGECARTLGRETPEDTEKIFNYMRALGGEITRVSEYCFGSLLWDVRVRHDRVIDGAEAV
jgi:SAM-dependent methyltransferase